MTENLDGIKNKGLDYLKAVFGEGAVEYAVDCTSKFMIEVPAWQLWDGFGGGGRFEGAGASGIAHTTVEIAEDAGMIQRLTKSTPEIGQHILWYFSEDGVTGDYDLAVQIKRELEANGVKMGSISPTYFLAGSEDGSFSSQDAIIRKGYVEQTLFGASIAAELGNGLLTLWFPDGTNYPGQRALQEKIGLMKECAVAFWDAVPAETKSALDKVLYEYKVFEPGTYSTTVPDWGTARELSRTAGDKGGVLVDMGHHHHGTNIEQIVSTLITFGVHGGFHFNTRYAADDDHSVQGDYEMARLFGELFRGNVIFNEDSSKNWAYALDQMARTEQRIPSILKSIDALKRSVAKAALVNTGDLTALQKRMDMIGSNTEYEKALLHTDTAPIVMEAYARQGLHPVPLIAYAESGYQDEIESKRSLR
ncbi:L-rhamnose isomerase [Candidatus Latescibacterota bacterium]